MTQPIPRKKPKRRCYFSDRWKDTYNSIREANDPHRDAEKNLGLGTVEKGMDVKIHMETEYHKSGMRRVVLLNQLKVSSSPQRIPALTGRLKLPN